MNFNRLNTKAGYWVSEGDKFHTLTQHMNMRPQPVRLFVTYTYEYLEGIPPAGWLNIKPVWVDVGNCSHAAVPVQKGPTFNLTGRTWISYIEGPMLGASGHVHNGGSEVQLVHNGEQAYVLNFGYGASSEPVQSPALENPNPRLHRRQAGMPGMKYISNTTICVDLGTLKMGDTLRVEASYDTGEYMPMVDNDGVIEEVMGMFLVLIGLPL
jgi:hypothetical protein